MSQSTTASPVEAAKAEVNRLFELERSLTEKRRAKAAEIQAIQQDAAHSGSDEASIEQLATRAIRAQFELRATEQSIELTRQRRVAAIKNRFRTEADALRSQAAELRSQVDAIRKKCAPFIDKLREAEGIPDWALLLWAKPAQDVAGHVAATVRRLMGQPEPERPSPPPEPEPDLRQPLIVPQSVRLLAEARELDRQAFDLETRPVQQDGSILKASVQDLLACEEMQNVERLAPAAHAVQDWAQRLEQRVQKERPELLNRPRRYHLVWRDGYLDYDDSTLSFPGSGVIAGDPTFTVPPPGGAA